MLGGLLKFLLLAFQRPVAFHQRLALQSPGQHLPEVWPRDFKSGGVIRDAFKNPLSFRFMFRFHCFEMDKIAVTVVNEDGDPLAPLCLEMAYLPKKGDSLSLDVPHDFSKRFEVTAVEFEFQRGAMSSVTLRVKPSPER